MAKIYLAAPLFSQSERDFNRSVAQRLEAMGHEVFLPQDHGDDLVNIVDSGKDPTKAQEDIFDMCSKGVDWCDTLLFVMDGRVPDEGACFELGLAYAWDKRCIGLKTDSRTSANGMDNPMIMVPLETVAKDLPSLDRIC